MMIISAFIKIAAVLLLTGFIGVQAILVLCIFYIVVIYIHIAHTGYYLSARKCSKMLEREENHWWDQRDSGINTDPMDDNMIVFQSLISLPNNETIRNGRQTLEVADKIDAAEGVIYNIRLSSRGLLWDEDIVSLLQNFPPNDLFYPTLIKACVKLQFSQLNIVSQN